MAQLLHQTPKVNRPKLGVFKFASCDGCQLSILNLEDDLLTLGQVLDISYFPEASSDMRAGPYDIALVEGSITTPEDAHRILSVREQAKVLITIGACATAGGIQALRNWADVEAFKRVVIPKCSTALPTSWSRSSTKGCIRGSPSAAPACRSTPPSKSMRFLL